MSAATVEVQLAAVQTSLAEQDRDMERLGEAVERLQGQVATLIADGRHAAGEMERVRSRLSDMGEAMSSIRDLPAQVAAISRVTAEMQAASTRMSIAGEERAKVLRLLIRASRMLVVAMGVVATGVGIMITYVDWPLLLAILRAARGLA